MQSTGLRRLVTLTLAEALAGMEVGESAIAPEGYSYGYVRKVCSELKRDGYLFSTSKKPSGLIVTRNR